ncbi:23S rRNA (pseudouridine(1915)-N(3))-methyltransferase RlmH [Arenicella xantha]|uniref:Ribosomal RNA large subunit methyltransferase H n=1 Tax=Arenicella xantha TaxID=644221 RepID=A0A395JNM9_9GAMM|nr:23S rRNA (pseudouridine(1915)-N(3))-methyltransferase RlmH [Arenicella xantha]RBP53251.1 23S rRNA (pseudouridine-1915-N(3)-) methyltransferase [Arenicella xantha]
MRIKLLAVGTKMPAWVEQGYREYAQRMPALCQLELHEIAAKKRGKNADTARILRDEAALLTAAIPESYLTIALDRRGKHIDTEGLATHLQSWIDDSQDIAILIGGPEGIDPNYLQQVRLKWSLSAMTFAHPVVRVMLAEQLYRAWSINANLPYHRGD